MGPQLFLVVGLLVCAATASDEIAAKGTTCFHIDKSHELPIEWISSVPVWYHLASSKLEQYRYCKDSLQIPIPRLGDKECFEEGCFRFRFQRDGKIFLDAFEQPTFKYQVTKFYPKLNRFEPWMDVRGYNGTLIIPFTDQSTYFITVLCAADWESTWGIYTTSPNPSNLESLIQKAESLGFKSSQTVRTPFTAKCATKRPAGGADAQRMNIGGGLGK